jgi:hypothetical protein
LLILLELSVGYWWLLMTLMPLAGSAVLTCLLQRFCPASASWHDGRREHSDGNLWQLD